MRIAHVITRMIIGGAQENTLLNCLGLVEDFGDEVLLITGPSEGPEGQLLERGRAGGLRVRVLDSLRRPIHLRDLWAYRQLVQVLSEFQPDVVHTHSAKGGFLGRAAASQCRVPAVVHTVHGAPFHAFQSWWARQTFIQLERWAARRCQRLISVADAMTDLMVEAQVAQREKFTTIYSGMEVFPFQDCHRFRNDARTELGFQDQHVVFGKIARLFHLKGHQYLVEAARSVIAQNPQVRFLFVGDGILRHQIESRIAKLGMGEYFHFTGLVPPERIPYYLSSMDALVHTSLREGLARTLPQAMIAGKPVISYDVDGAREVVVDGQTGYLLPPKSIFELAEAMNRLSVNPGLRYRLGQGGCDRCTQQFDHRTMTLKIREVYESLLANTAQGR